MKIQLRSKLAMLLLCAASTASLAIPACAAAATEPGTWRVGSTEANVQKLIGSAPYTARITPETKFQFNWSTSGKAFAATATGVEAIGSSITNESVVKPGAATGVGKFKFTGVKFTVPDGCAIANNEITSYSLFSEAVTVGTKTYERILPVSGETYFTMALTNSGSESCSLAGSYQVKGELYASAEGLKTAHTAQRLNFSNAIEKELGGELRLLGFGPLQIEGSLVETLSGSYLNQFWRGW